MSISSFVFVDDNPVELEEVRGVLPEVECLAFQSEEQGFLLLFEKLHNLFRTDSLTDEDRNRTDLYRNRVAGIVPVKGRAHDITTFLADLNMTLTLHNRSQVDFKRALQLINKTNQFNMPTTKLGLQGKHNTKNAMAAATVSQLLRIRKETIIRIGVCDGQR